MKIVKLNTKLLILIVLISFGCQKEKIRSGIAGEFAIDSMSYKGEDLMYFVNLNFLEFNSNGTVKIPAIIGDNILTDDNNISGNWNVEKKGSSYYLSINTKNRYFNGEYKITFVPDDDRKFLYLYLKNDSVNIKSTKSFFNYNGSVSFAHDISELTK